MTMRKQFAVIAAALVAAAMFMAGPALGDSGEEAPGSTNLLTQPLRQVTATFTANQFSQIASSLFDASLQTPMARSAKAVRCSGISVIACLSGWSC